ncbi:MAG: electron transfer flavoprotein subunit alpha/FixB family protein [candidate division WOR-3 bacterium]
MIVTVIEHDRGQLKDISFELLTLAHKLSQTKNEPVAAVVLADNSQPFVEPLAPYAHKILVIEDPLLGNFNNYLYFSSLSKLLTELRPAVTLFGHTGQGTDLAPYLASFLGWPIITDIFDSEFTNGQLLARRTMFGGKINAKVLANSLPVILTLRQGSFDKINSGTFNLPTIKAEVEKFSVTLEPSLLTRSKFLEYAEAPTTGIDITKAEVIVAVGRGIKEEKNLKMVEEFAQEIGGTLACTRPIIDAGWLPKDRQVGSSGKTVKPKLYIALGISGAFQHISGMKGSELIIAVNKDPEAPIFSVAHYGVVADLFKVLPALANKIKELKSR